MTDSTTVQCGPEKDPTVRGLILICMLLAASGWFIYDVTIAGNYERVEYSKENINPWFEYWFNYIGQIVAPVLTLVVLAFFIRFRNRKVIANAEGLSVGKRKIAWSDVTKLDASQLKNKGLVILECGDSKPIKLDDWKLTNFKALLEIVENNVPAEAKAQ